MELAIWQTALIVIIAFLYGLDNRMTSTLAFTSVLAGLLIGLIMGDPMTGLQVGATVQLMSLGVAQLGGSSVPDYQLTAIVATYLCISTHQSVGVGIAVGLPVGLLGVQLDVMVKILNGFIVRRAQSHMEAGEYAKMTWAFWPCPILFGLTCALPTFLVLMFGTDAVNLVVSSMPAWFTTGLSIAGAALPVVGMAMLLTFMPVNKYISFVIIGYVLAAYLKLGVLPIALLGAAAAFESYKQLSARGGAVAVEGGVLEDE